MAQIRLFDDGIGETSRTTGSASKENATECGGGTACSDPL
jgi:hypothetical protein